MKRFFLFSLSVFALLPQMAIAASADRLVEIINAYRAAPPACEGEHEEPQPPLAPDTRLAQLTLKAPAQLRQAMRASGYRAARAEAISLSGPETAKEAFRYAAAQHCRLLLNSAYSAIGVSRQGKEWIIVVAQPLLADDLGDWRSAGKQVLEKVNVARATERYCGGRYFAAAGPLRWSDALAAAALKHSRDMMRRGYFAHEGRDGRSVADRVQAEGYRWRRVGENIAAGQGSAESVVQGWLSSPGHCANIMNGDFSEMGVAYAHEQNSEAGIYWTQVFARPL